MVTRLLAALATSLVLSGSTGAQCWSPGQLLTAPNPEGPDYFGRALGLEGDTLAVGAPGLPGSSGAIHLYDRSSTGWVRAASLAPPGDAYWPEDFGRRFVLDGGTLAVAHGRRVVFFEQVEGTWTQVAEAATSMLAGGGVDLEGDWLAVGHPPPSGFTVHHRDQGGPGAWGEVAYVPDPTSGWLGLELEFDDDVLVAGEPLHDGGPIQQNNMGRVQVFERDLGGSGAWGLSQVLLPTIHRLEARFGSSVVIRDDALLVTAPNLTPSKGRLYVYRRNPPKTGDFELDEVIPPPQPMTLGQQWPNSLALEGDLLLTLDDGPIGGSPIGVLFAADGLGGWNPFDTFAVPTPNPSYGYTAVLDASQVLIGYDFGTFANGEVRAFDVSDPAASYCTPGTSASGCAVTLHACGTPSASAGSGFAVRAVEVECCTSGLFFVGTSGSQAVRWGNGTSIQCVVPPLMRGPVLKSSPGSKPCDAGYAEDLNARWCPTCPLSSQNPPPGTTMQVQFWYRDPQSTSNQTTSLSNALQFVVGV